MMAETQTLDEAIRALATNPKEEGAWHTLFLTLWPYVAAVVTRHRPELNHADVVDLSQQAMVNLFKVAPFARIADGVALRAYLATVARRLAELHSKSHPVGRLTSLEFEPAEGNSAGATLDLGLDLELLQKHLSRDETELIRQLAEGLTTEEIALKFGISVDAAAARISRIRKKLRDLRPSQRAR